MNSVRKLHKLLHTLSDINRLRIIQCIGHREPSVSEIVDVTELSQPLVSHHLKILKKNAIVETNRKGPFIYYRLAWPELLEILGVLSELAQGIDDSEPVPPMFQCPPWWGRIHKMKKQ